MSRLKKFIEIGEIMFYHLFLMKRVFLQIGFSKKRHALLLSFFAVFFPFMAPIVCLCPSLVNQHNQGDHAHVPNHQPGYSENSNYENEPHHEKNSRACFCPHAPQTGILHSKIAVNYFQSSSIAVLQKSFQLPDLNGMEMKYFRSYHPPPESLPLYLKKSSFLI